MKGKIVENIEVTDIADKGLAVGRSNERVVFVEGAVPGDIVDARIVKKRKNFLQGKITKMRHESEYRVDHFCTHFGVCGGCKWQNLDYKTQLKFKEKNVNDAFHKIGGLTDVTILPIIGSDPIRHYRNKLEYSFTDKRYLLEEEMNEEEKEMEGLGFHVPGKFNKIVDIEKCWLQDDLSNSIRLFVKKKAIEKKIPFFNPKNQTGVMRSLIIRNTSLGEWMVVVVFREEHPEWIEYIMGSIKSEFPDLTSLVYMINPKRNDTIYDIKPHIYYGRDVIIEQLDDLKFKIGVKSFFQTNSKQAQVLYNITKEFAGLSGNEIVYDLYTGTGTIAAYLARSANSVLGIESVPEAIEDAKQNSSMNEILNTKFLAGDMAKMLTPEFIAINGQPDVVITDPPRPGMHEKVTRTLLDCGAKKIVYVSCNAATQARDIAILSENYTVEKVQPVDMFPHTSHVESVALLIRK